MNRKIAVVLSGIMLICALTGCNGKNNNSNEANSAVSASSAASNSSSEEDTSIALFDGLDSKEKMPFSEVDTDEFVTLGEYKGVTVEIAAPNVTDEEVEETIKNLAMGSPLIVDVTDRAVQTGDVVNIDFEGKYADTKEAFNGGTAQGYDLEIGSGAFIPGFEDALIGVEIGDSKDIPLTFPSDYGAAELAGKDVIFTVKVNKISVKSSDVTDEWAKSLAFDGVTDVASLKDYARENLLKEATNNYETQLREEVTNIVEDNCTFKELPEEVYNSFLALQRDTILSLVDRYYSMTNQQATMEDIVKMMMQYGGEEAGTPEEYVQKLVKSSANRYVMLAAIAKNEGLEVTDEEVDAFIKDIYGKNYSTEEVSLETLKEELDVETVRQSLLADKVNKFLAENANVVEPVNN